MFAGLAPVVDDDAMPQARRDVNIALTSMVTQRRLTQHQTPNAAIGTNEDLTEPSEDIEDISDSNKGAENR